MEGRKFVAYMRVSTKMQEESKLGLEAQKEIITRKVKELNGEVIQEFIEIESGKKNDRPQLNQAIALCKEANATLIIAKLDRLSRSVSFIFSLKESNIDFIACDMPHLNTLTLGVLASFAQYERETISQRIRDALGALKARGISLGSPQNLNEKARKKGRTKRTQVAKEKYTHAFCIANDLKKKGYSLQEIADTLNLYDIKTYKGRTWSNTQVRRMLVKI